MSELDRRRAAGELPEALHAFERAKVELWATGQRRLFTCGRCGNPFSLGWKRCDYCRATLDEFPPIDTGKSVADPRGSRWWGPLWPR